MKNIKENCLNIFFKNLNFFKNQNK